ncbi:uncharacterized protein LOC103524116 [Caerostris extrusa]|uniref:Uncharacterized protein LOC103524116 n=1 Tax=Caerostris extrusa TaxID=172846 RepID=A0AAV4WB49_CAEEX|nr:uncharacterized protein LOC103524116 [Caerostris extrusa]
MVTLATSGERFPEQYWLHEYTDGSATRADNNAGAGVYSRDFSLNMAVGANCSKFDGEVTVVHMALTEIINREEQNIVIFIDSQAIITAISSIMPPKNSSLLECQLLIDSVIEGGNNVTLQWAPSHCVAPSLQITLLSRIQSSSTRSPL